jgi:alpha-beta hydrolase superfamily lysophospholipase
MTPKFVRPVLVAVVLALASLPALASYRAPDETAAYPLSIPEAGTAKAKYEPLEVSARDDTKLVVHEWAPANVVPGKPVILFIHGMGMHGKPYKSIQAGFTSRGLVFVVPDLRGHGSSGGTREELAEPHVLRADIGAVIALVNNRYPEAPVVLVGESMGGLIAADYAWRGERRLGGLVLLAPAFDAHPALKAIAVQELKDLIKNKGRILLTTDENFKLSTRDEGFIKARKADKVALPAVKPTYIATIAASQRDWPDAAAGIKVPLFVGVGSEDKIVDAKQAKAVFDAAKTPKAAKTWRQWDDACHTLCWDPLTPKVMEEVAQWALKLPRGEPKKKGD